MARDLLLLHGAGLGAWIWDRVLPHLALPARALDLPGCGDGTPLGAVTLEQSIQLVTGNVGDGTVIVGHSFTATTALAAATRTNASVILVGGIVPESGKPFTSILPFPQRLILGLLLRRAKNGIALPASLVRKEYCNDLDPETTDLVLRNVTREAPRLYLDAAQWSPRAPRT